MAKGPPFNYGTIQGLPTIRVAVRSGGDGKLAGFEGGGGYSRLPRTALPWRRPGESAARRKSLALASAHTRVRTQACARRHTSPRLRRNPCRTRPETVTFTALLLFNFHPLHSLPHAHTPY